MVDPSAFCLTEHAVMCDAPQNIGFTLREREMLIALFDADRDTVSVRLVIIGTHCDFHFSAI